MNSVKSFIILVCFFFIGVVVHAQEAKQKKKVENPKQIAIRTNSREKAFVKRDNFHRRRDMRLMKMKKRMGESNLKQKENKANAQLKQKGRAAKAKAIEKKRLAQKKKMQRLKRNRKIRKNIRR